MKSRRDEIIIENESINKQKPRRGDIKWQEPIHKYIYKLFLR